MFGDEQHLQRDRRSNPTHRDRHRIWLLRSTSDPGEHRRELRKGSSDRGLLRTGPVRGRYVDTDARNVLNRWPSDVAASCPDASADRRLGVVLTPARGVPERAPTSRWGIAPKCRSETLATASTSTPTPVACPHR